MTRPPAGPDYGFGLYVHWPYCSRICPYCDFNVYTARRRDTSGLLAAICADLARHRARLPDHGPLDSVFLGGGTPSLLAPAEIARILDTARQAFGLREDAEITLEANPGDVLRADLAGWRVAGVNRLSLGVQSLDDAALAFLGREHSAADAHRAIDLSLQRFASVSGDFIYARPGQTIPMWDAELATILALGLHHLSLYELTIEPATAFGRRARRGALQPAGEAVQADLFELTQARTKAAGYPAYEISNHARATAHESRHNHIYWASGDWIGVGPGAHGRLTTDHGRLATLAPAHPDDYGAAAVSGETFGPGLQTLSPDEIAAEILIMGLRPSHGLDPARIARARGFALSPARLSECRDAGLVCQGDDGRLRLTEPGRLLADAVAARLLGD